MSQKTIKGAVAIPLIRSLATGALCALFVAFLYNLSQGATAWRIFWVVLSSCALVSWLLIIQRERSPVETRVYPETIEPITPVEIIENAGAYSSGQYLDLPIDRPRMIAIAVELESGASFSHSLAGPGKILTRGDYERLRDYMLRRGLLRWNSAYSRKEGVSLTGKGRALVRGLAASELPTLLPLGDSKRPELAEYAQSTHTVHRGGNY